MSTSCECMNGDESVWSVVDAQRISERSPESIEADLHDVPVRERNAFAEAQAARSEVMDVDVARPTVSIELEMMMLHVVEAVRHVRFAGDDLLRPDDGSVPLDDDRAGDGIERRAYDELRTERAGANLRAREIEIVSLLEPVIGELVAVAHPDSPRLPVVADDVHAGDFRLLATVLSVRRQHERLVVRAEHQSVSLVEPFGRDANLPRRRTSALDAP